jgi:hypothetical protein
VPMTDDSKNGDLTSYAHTIGISCYPAMNPTMYADRGRSIDWTNGKEKYAKVKHEWFMRRRKVQSQGETLEVAFGSTCFHACKTAQWDNVLARNRFTSSTNIRY